MLLWLQVLAKEGWDNAMMRRCRLAFFGKVRFPSVTLHVRKLSWPARTQDSGRVLSGSRFELC
jgi:hypothetical protein